jgi:hypothetical protein
MSRNFFVVLSSGSRSRLEKPLVAQLIISHRDIAVGVHRLWAGSLGFQSSQEENISLFSKNAQSGSGAHPVSYSKGTGVLPPGILRPGWGSVDFSPQSIFMVLTRKTFLFNFCKTQEIRAHRSSEYCANKPSRNQKALVLLYTV